MLKSIIADTSCFIILSNIGELELLQKVYGSVITTEEVAAEFGEVLPEWIEVKAVTDKFRQKILEIQVDKGEASAIALAFETPKSIVILDDLKARRIAEQLGLLITGTIGVLIKAKILGHIISIKPFLQKIGEMNFRLSDELIKLALIEAGEELS